jgi:hypothetical protein
MLPGASNLVVNPLRLRESDLNVERMLTLMSVDKGDEKPPLYIEIIRKILREMANNGNAFSYSQFKRKLALEDLTPAQKSPLNLRLEILESFMV